MANPRPSSRHFTKVSSMPKANTPDRPVGVDKERDKKYKSSFTIYLQRRMLKLRMLPKPMQMALGLATILVLVATAVWGTTCFLRLGIGIGSLSSSSYDPEARFYNRPHFPASPRVLQLVDDTLLTVTVLPADDKDNPHLPKEYPELVERYNPMPHDNVKLKAASTLDKGECQRIADWQVGHTPNCNVVHEASSGFAAPLLLDRSYEQIQLVAGGAFRWVWKIKEFDGTPRALKTLRVDSKTKVFDLRNFDRHRRDAVAMEQLTASPLVVDMYGYCSNTGLFDWGEGGDLESIFERDPDISKEQLLTIAYNVSLSISHAHHFDHKGRATMAHTDIKPDQFLYQNGYYRLTDFNRVRFLMWNDHSNLQCGFRVQKNGGIWRSPEEYNYEIETEKVDVYSLGNVLYFMLTGEEPWEEYKPKDVYDMVKNKKRPRIPTAIRNSRHVYDVYMIKAIEMAWTHSMFDRPSALEIANTLKEGIGEL
jgi:hypothetical protein